LSASSSQFTRSEVGATTRTGPALRVSERDMFSFIQARKAIA
jgi:hypothetical protein